MSEFDRRQFIKATAGLGAAGLGGIAGCTGGPSGGDDEDTTESTTESGDETGTETESTTSSESDVTNVGMVYATGGLGDGSFNDQAQQGLFAAADEYNIEYEETQPDSATQFSNYQQQLAGSTNPDYDLVSCIGFLQKDSLSETSTQYPDQDFQIVDEVVDEPNVASYTFREHEGSFLVGVLASTLTTQSFSAGAGATQSDSTNLGFVGGVEGGLIKKFEAGFKAGVKYANDDVDVSTSYIGSFNDPSGGKEAALQMYSSGADIIYHASGNTGTGVFQAAQQEGKFAVGVDRDQSVTKSSYADVILASMAKRVDTAVYNAIEAKVNGEYPGGEHTTLGLQEEGVSCVYGQQLGSEIPSDVKTAVEDARTGIIEGDISVPTDPSNV
ncbi:BMP family lipoprotein [Halobacterium litoreum]|uniref:BMP family protein n=1 Tax=Halobacterium litoreum TaxID=2039234 RepID=A0ABD5N852_9EURY|nr:BMP family protein [Halobacterium litoreum]UHH12121.1 BMP family protein [Halobacterium litoreum]